MEAVKIDMSLTVTLFLNKYHGIYEKVGEITDVGYASVFAEGQATEDRFVIDDVVCKIGDCEDSALSRHKRYRLRA